ncbi:hypothetical protein GDO81_019889 [Engystomops pustulosus]|uniref:Uncharacterized protein n=1 Tax=Engystomops pustulosus TaxID=76066 RepID=A0AAV6YRN4_ENGPU|nr:hypothetical protein GDO81_019889 [Engystomops pustulosus]
MLSSDREHGHPHLLCSRSAALYLCGNLLVTTGLFKIILHHKTKACMTERPAFQQSDLSPLYNKPVNFTNIYLLNDVPVQYVTVPYKLRKENVFIDVIAISPAAQSAWDFQIIQWTSQHEGLPSPLELYCSTMW